MPKLVAYIGFGICFIVFSGAMLALTPAWKKIFKGKHTPALSTVTISSVPIIGYGSVVPNSSKQSSPSNRPPMFLDIIFLICMFIIFAFGIGMMYLWITGKLIGTIGFGQILLFVFSIIIPILVFIDIFHWQRKQYKLGRSYVYKDKIVKLDGDKNNIFDVCFKILDTTPKSTILEANKPKLVKALINGYIITITIRLMRNKKVAVHIESDSQWVTVKIDWGVNQRKVNNIDRLIRSEVGH